MLRLSYPSQLMVVVVGKKGFDAVRCRGPHEVSDRWVDVGTEFNRGVDVVIRIMKTQSGVL